MERIGNVKLNDEYYSGFEKISSEAAGNICALFENGKDFDESEAILSIGSYDALCALSHIRPSVVEFLSIKNARVLELGAKSGALTEHFLQNGCEVVAVEPSRALSHINAYRNREYELVVNVGSYKDVRGSIDGKFDYVVLASALDDASVSGYPADMQQLFLSDLRALLKDNSKLVILADNKYGMRYMSGARERYTGKVFEGVEGFVNSATVRTHTKKSLLKLLSDAGFGKTDVYYPYPDYMFAMDIFSDDRLPDPGCLDRADIALDGDRIKTFNEARAFDSAIEDGMFDIFTNSFLAVAYCDNAQREQIVYSRYSVERSEDKQIRTSIYKDKQVTKTPYTSKARAYVDGIYETYRKLIDTYDQNYLKINKCHKTDEGVSFEYVSGDSLEKLMDRCLAHNDIAGVRGLLDNYKDRVGHAIAGKQFELTAGFVNVFGVRRFNKDLVAAAYADIDLIFSNIIVDNEWTVIDYEWTFDFPVPLNYIFYRAIYDYVYKSDKRSVLWKENLYEYMGISEAELCEYQAMDVSFHSYVSGGNVSLGVIAERLGNTVYDAASLMTSKNPDIIQIYMDKGNGFSEEESAFVKADKTDDGFMRVTVGELSGCRHLRIDPADTFCAVYVKSIAGTKSDGSNVSLSYYADCVARRNGYDIYKTDDPQMFIKNMSGDIDKVELVFKVEELSEEYAGALKERFSRLRFKVNNRLYGGS